MRALSRQGTVKQAAVLATVVGMAVWAPRTAAADSQRALRWQFSVPVTFVSGTTFDAQEGTNFKLNDDVGWGFGFGYNLNQHFMVGADFTWLSANYTAHMSVDNNGDQRPDTTVDAAGTLDVGNFQLVGQYNIMKGRFSPFLRANFGWAWIDSNIPSGPPVGGCWWDPWYGYVCSSSQPTYGSTRFAYGVAGGLRGELTDRFYLEASYNVIWLETSNSGTPSFDGVRVAAGWTF